ncbi:MAG: glycosyltransferase [Bacteroidaceae bacterium]|nr:glycosyltransferase [Bacteroidaceae bacterium]MCF0186210.1 glycosyltransferase [Bacteroidaceae bacterium]
MKFSIITINLNNAKGLEKTILSVIGQTFQDYEYIIIDGGSTDGSLDIIQKYEAKITKWVSEPDKGIYNAMNKGTSMAQGDYLCYMNSGDCMYDSKTLHLVAQNANTDLVLGWVEVDGKILKLNHEITALYLFKHYLCHQAAYIKNDLANSLPYNENLKISSDMQFFAINCNSKCYSKLHRLPIMQL